MFVMIAIILVRLTLKQKQTIVGDHFKTFFKASQSAHITKTRQKIHTIQLTTQLDKIQAKDTNKLNNDDQNNIMATTR